MFDGSGCSLFAVVLGVVVAGEEFSDVCTGGDYGIDVALRAGCWWMRIIGG